MEFICHKSRLSFDRYSNEKVVSSTYMHLLKSGLKKTLFLGGMDFDKLKHFYPLDGEKEMTQRIREEKVKKSQGNTSMPKSTAVISNKYI